MKIIIDGVQYVPLNEQPKGHKFLDALEIRFNSDAGDGITVREYLRILLMTLWEEKEDFSGKRPFGNSSWKYELYEPLIKAGFITGELDEEGRIESVDKTQAHTYVCDLILAVFHGVQS